MSLSESIQAAIRDKLPEQVAGELRRYLEKAKRDEEEIGVQQRDNKLLTEICGKKERELEELRAKVKAGEDLEARRVMLDSRERAFELEIAKVKSAAAEEKAKLAVELVSLVFRNPRLTYSEQVNSQVPVGIPSGGYAGLHSGFESRNRTVEETK